MLESLDWIDAAAYAMRFKETMYFNGGNMLFGDTMETRRTIIDAVYKSSREYERWFNNLTYEIDDSSDEPELAWGSSNSNPYIIDNLRSGKRASFFYRDDSGVRVALPKESSISFDEAMGFGVIDGGRE